MITLFEYLEDWDDNSLQGYDWYELMEEQVESYNNEYGTNYDPRRAVISYKSWKREKQYGDY